MTAIIVDDEIQSHDVLRKLISKSHPDIVVLASAFTIEEGDQKISTLKPDIVFLDIELPDGLGFDLLKRFPEPEFSVIFITAFDKYAVTAIQFGALYYILKPANEEKLAEAMQRVHKNDNKKISLQQLQILYETLANIQAKKLPSRMSISTADGILYLEVKNIIRLEAQQNYTEFTIAGNAKKTLSSVNLGEYEEQFELYHDFARVHRSHLVNINYIDKLVKSDGGYLVMKNGDNIPISRKYKDDLLDKLGHS